MVGLPCMRRGTRIDGAVWAEVELPLPRGASTSEYFLHPALLDACFHGMIAADADFDHTPSDLYLPSEIRRLRVWRRAESKVRVHVRMILKNSQRMIADVHVFDMQGNPVISLEGFSSQRVQSVCEVQ